MFGTFVLVNCILSITRVPTRKVMCDVTLSLNK